MKYTNRLINLGQQLSQKYAQTTSAQAGDVENALKSAGVWEKANEVGAMLGNLGVPDDASVSISIKVSSGLDFTYPVVLAPDNKPVAFKVGAALKIKYGPIHKAALQKAGLHVTDALVLNWMKF